MSRKFHRIQRKFLRISLVSAIDSQTLALIPQSPYSVLIEQTIRSAIHLREGERIVSAPSVLRPETPTEELPFFDWQSTPN